MTLFIYVFLTFISLFPLYYIAAHLFYSEKLYLNLLAFVLMGCCTVTHYLLLLLLLLMLIFLFRLYHNAKMKDSDCQRITSGSERLPREKMQLRII